MKQDIAMAWARRLREIPDRQTRVCLIDTEGRMCCLGVLKYEVLGHGKPQDFPENGKYGGVLDRQAMEDAGMGSEGGRLPEGGNLIALNDRGYDFETIAGIIEDNWEHL